MTAAGIATFAINGNIEASNEHVDNGTSNVVYPWAVGGIVSYYLIMWQASLLSMVFNLGADVLKKSWFTGYGWH